MISLGVARSSAAEQPTSQRIVDGSPVVRIHEAQVPQLGALIDVGDARRRELQQSLGERVDPAGGDQRRDERLHVDGEAEVGHRGLDEAPERRVVRLVGLVQEV
jgi:hypothetical protein